MLPIYWLYVLMILYDVSFIYEHGIAVYCEIWWWLLLILCYVILGLAYDPLFGLLGWVRLRGLHGNYSCRANGGLWVRVLYMFSCYELLDMLCCYNIMLVLFVYVLKYAITHVDLVILDDVVLVFYIPRS